MKKDSGGDGIPAELFHTDMQNPEKSDSETESRLVFARPWGVGEMRYWLKGTSFQL